eukprot:gnl/MRDRNA2_/MRDRNA2_27143_c0_seq1.p1 gnl/MRDRNA2_/MRDRNA2_27143_c0~~gnl/MRDRNA2_/MRDRNA2_27143_c0_seq1.p1  ORF type:complete len:617 (+),score=122.48 gnl/MRDRNA2_/MRDRNA2_27143_c0_seq1:59-1909(+)
MGKGKGPGKAPCAVALGKGAGIEFKGAWKDGYMSYKEQQEQQLRELEDKMSASQSFSGKSELSAEEHKVIFERANEAAGSGEYTKFKPKRGYFSCRKCANPIYSYQSKLDNGMGWPSFDMCYNGAVDLDCSDDGTNRTEITCKRCRAHLGDFCTRHGTRGARTDQCHIVNSLALMYLKYDPPEDTSEESALPPNVLDALNGKRERRYLRKPIAAVQSASGCPSTIVVGGIECEPGLNGTYERNGMFRGDRPQWMKPASRCYIRWIRDRWEIYVSHHPSGTTYFFHATASAFPPASGWIPTECAMPHEEAKLSFMYDDEAGEAAALPAPERPLQHWCNHVCPFAQRVRIAIHEKALTELTEEHLVDVIGDKDPDFVALYNAVLPNADHRRPAIPLLEHRLQTNPGTAAARRTVVLIESKIIVEYLDEVASDISSGTDQASASLMPTGAAQRAALRLFVDTFQRELSPCLHSILNASSAEALRGAAEGLSRGIATVEGCLVAHGGQTGPYFCDDLFTLAEVLLAPDLQRLLTLVPHFRPQIHSILARPLQRSALGARDDAADVLGPLGPVLKERAPTLHRWAAAVMVRPSVESTYPFEAVAAMKQRAVPNWTTKLDPR